jgi:large subunit ribosomal protein LP0
MVKGDRAAWKATYFTKVTTLFDNFSKCFVVGADNVGSTQMQEIRASMRGKATLLMGKNTMMRKAMRGHVENIPGLENLLPLIVYNVGLVFTNDDLCEVRDLLLMNKKRAPARAGAIAPCIVTVPSQNTGLGPEKTSFFQALQIPTKISRGTIEIVNDIQLLKEGDKVGLSEATLLNMLNISPFTYGLVIQHVYDQGTVFSPKVLDIKNDDIVKSFMEGLAAITAVSLAISYPTVASVPHSVVNGFKNVLAIAAVTDYTFKEATTLKEILADPSKLAAIQAAAAAAPAAGGAPAAAADAPAAKEAAKEEPEEESDDDMGFGLFD